LTSINAMPNQIGRLKKIIKRNREDSSFSIVIITCCSSRLNR